MPQSLQKHEPELSAQLKALEQEISFLEKELGAAENEVNIFTARIRNQLSPQIRRIQELVALYKKQKREKKEKRLAQKKKGKHYKAPSDLPNIKNGSPSGRKTNENDLQNRKRLYKEAIVQVHPDKFVNDDETLAQKANELTKQLNELYDSGDLEELKGFHEHILSGNAMAHIPYQPESIKNPAAMLTYLQQKQAELRKNLEEIKTSELYHVLKTYQDPLTFIPELGRQFADRISVFEKRTRQKKGK